ncbi:MAG: hypothetical protein M9928_15735 [Anaerolineae bacterium]|nr:hypothetical protein [Anaerolineae bacterium]MCO5196051.1 hypothetical protein [Anaerolineae bacterium]MCO5199609.1 hypothetical protein [Anaerolineae bacterium]MCO5206487.1 hypothetical protein [Anaerolineae bacterium]
MNGLETEFDGKVTFVRLNAAQREVEQLQQQLGLRGHPAVGLLNSKGHLVERYFGVQSAETLRQRLQRLASP